MFGEFDSQILVMFVVCLEFCLFGSFKKICCCLVLYFLVFLGFCTKLLLCFSNIYGKIRLKLSEVLLLFCRF